jgi:flavin-dependent dehydrogenase
LLVDRRATIVPRIGESLLPAARRLLADMGLWGSFVSEGHEPWHGNRAVWGGAEPRETDFLRDPDGHGWHLDRARFEQWLCSVARDRGADLLRSASLHKLKRDGHRWLAQLKTEDGLVEIAADLIIDAGGRAAPVARKLGVRAQANDKLVCAWVYGSDRSNASRGLTYVEAVKDGWWYTAPIPGNRRVLAFHTDADLSPFARVGRKRDILLERTGAIKELSELLASVGFAPESKSGFAIANSTILEPAAGERWLAVGDAAISFDPLSSQGLLNALFTGLAAAEAAERHLKGDLLSLSSYSQIIRGIRDSYQRHLAFYYASEARWPEAPFWQRRHRQYALVDR